MPTVISTKMPNQIAFMSFSKPHKSSPMMAGKITGMVNSSIESSSITQPNTTYKTNTALTTSSGEIGKWVTQSAIRAGISVSASEAFIISAPRKIMNTMALVSAEATNARLIPAPPSSRRAKPTAMVRRAPIAAPSVGEKIPP